MSNLSTATHFCFSCGREIRVSAAAAASLICEVCEARYGGRTAPSYTIKPRDGQPIGPLTREQVVVELKRGTVDGESLISESGDGLDRMDHHPHFLSYFIPESAQAGELEAARADYSKQQSTIQREKVTAPLKRMIRGGLLVAAPVGVFLAVKFLVPAEVKQGLADKARAAYADAELRVNKAMDEEAAVADLRATTELPGAELVAGLQAKWPEVTDGSAVLSERGWAGLMLGVRAAVAAAETNFEQAVSRNPDDPLALSGLAVAYAITSRGQGEKSQQSITALERARQLGTNEALVMRGQAGIAVSSRAYVQGVESAGACVEADPEDGYCLYYKGRSELGMGGLSKAVASLQRAKTLLPDAPAVTVALALAQVEQGDYASAIGPLEAFAAANASDADTLTMMAEIWLDLGDGDKALSYATRAAALDAEQLTARSIQGALQLHLRGDARAALGVLKPVVPMEGLRRIRDWRQTVVHASHAARLSGDTETALAFADIALVGQTSNGPALMAKALAYIAAGEPAEAEGVFKQVELSDMSELDQARYLYGEGKFYLEQDRMSVASETLTDAVAVYPDWGDASLALAMAYASVKNPTQAAETLASLYDKDLQRQRRKGAVQNVWIATIDPGAIARVIRPQFESDARYSGQYARVSGILHAVRCLSGDGNCDLAISQLGKSVKSDDGDYVSRAFLGRIAMSRGDWRGALEHFERALNRDSNKPILLAMKGRCHYVLGQPDDGEAAFKKALNISESTPGVYFHQGEALRAAGDTAGAKRAYESVLKIDPDDVTSRGRLLALGR